MDFLYKALGKWGQVPWPPAIENIARVGAARKKGNYRAGDHSCLGTGFPLCVAASGSLGRFGALRGTLLARAAAASVQA